VDVGEQFGPCSLTCVSRAVRGAAHRIVRAQGRCRGVGRELLSPTPSIVPRHRARVRPILSPLLQGKVDNCNSKAEGALHRLTDRFSVQTADMSGPCSCEFVLPWAKNVDNDRPDLEKPLQQRSGGHFGTFGPRENHAPHRHRRTPPPVVVAVGRGTDTVVVIVIRHRHTIWWLRLAVTSRDFD